MSAGVTVWAQHQLSITTNGRGSYDITAAVQSALAPHALSAGVCHLFVQHTSASLMVCENADPAVRDDLETLMGRVAPDGDPAYSHTAEGPDDMAAHMRSVITHTDLTLPVTNGRCALGTWQGIYLWEHRTAGHQRHITLTVQGAAGP